MSAEENIVVFKLLIAESIEESTMYKILCNLLATIVTLIPLQLDNIGIVAHTRCLSI